MFGTNNNIFSSSTLPGTEHGLVMLLLLYGLLTCRGKRFLKWVPAVIVVGILLSLFTPVHEIEFFGPVITGLVVPPFLWRGAVAVTKSGPIHRQLSLAIWIITPILVTLNQRFFELLPLSNALLLGILAVTLVWYFQELIAERSYLSTIGLITLVVLLEEIDLSLVSAQPWLATFISGTSIGTAVGYLGIYFLRKLRWNKWKNVFFFIWAYVSYLIGLALGTSAIASTLAAVLMVSIYGYSTGFWYRNKDIPVPSAFLFFFYLSAVIWITLGWQAHTVLNPISLSGIFPALVVITISILIVLLRISIKPLFELFGVEPGWPIEDLFILP